MQKPRRRLTLTIIRPGRPHAGKLNLYGLSAIDRAVINPWLERNAPTAILPHAWRFESGPGYARP